MSSKIFKNYQNPELFLTNEQVIERIKYLTDSLSEFESFYRRHQPEVLTKEQREEILLRNEIQEEIGFYEDEIFGFIEEITLSDCDEEEHTHKENGNENEEEIRLLKQQVSKLEDTLEFLVRVIKDRYGVNIDTNII